MCACVGNGNLTYLPGSTELREMGLKGLTLKLNQFGKTKRFWETQRTRINPKIFPALSYPDFLEKVVSQNPNTETLTFLNAQKAKQS